MAYSTITKPSLHFNTKLYVADQQDNRTITGVGFQPDFVWLKDRDQAVSHQLYDAVRGSLKSLASNNTNSKATETDTLKAFASDGFTLGTGWGNQSTGDNYVSWNWKANGAGSANTDGSINSTVSVNTTAGFSVVTYTGTGSTATVGHGLGVKPDIVIYKERNTTNAWRIMHDINGTLKRIYLNTTAAEVSITDSSTAPTNTLLNIGTGSEVNRDSNATYVAYCFAEKKGYSKFGSYTGNGNADGTFIYTGFKPAFIIVKRTDSVNNWTMYDNKRNNPFNEITHTLIANGSDAESTSTSDDDCDFLSNGVKMRCSNNGSNGSSASYIYMAFAEEPLVANVGASIPATAR